MTTENRSNVRGIFGTQEAAIQRLRDRYLRRGRDLQARHILALSNVAQGRRQVRTQKPDRLCEGLNHYSL